MHANAASTIWASRGGVKPLSTPKCGFDGKGCPVDFLEEYKGYLIAAIVLAIFIFFGIIYGIIYIIRLRSYERERQNRLWQIPSVSLVRLADRVRS